MPLAGFGAEPHIKENMSSLIFAADKPWLAPLAGWSDLPFRLLCRESGAAVCCTEMVSAKGLVYGGRNTEELLATRPDDNPLVVQLFGAEAPFLEKAVHLLQERGFEYFDLNMGCSVPKVTKTGSGSALLRTPEVALEVGEALIRAAGEGKVGFKLRLGWEKTKDGSPNLCHELAHRFEDMGAGWITLHPRYARQSFTGIPDYAEFEKLAASLSIPLIASGDLFYAEDGVRVLKEHGASAVMYARGAMSDPTIFARHLALLEGKTMPQPTRVEIAALVRRHMELARELCPATALLKMRTFVPRYLKSLDGARSLRQRLIQCTDWEGLDSIINDIASGPDA